MIGSPEPLYNRIGAGYDITRKADVYLTSRLIAHLGCSCGDKILDLACGTGNYSVALSKNGFGVTGVDASERMIESAQLKSRQVKWCLADARSLPFGSGSFDGAICTLAIHHFPGLERPFAEVFRALKTGRFAIFTSTPEQMQGYWLNEYFPEALKKSILQMPSFEAIEAALALAGFCSIRTEIYEVRPDLQDKFLYSGKENPQYYLDAKVRAGISMFANLASAKEIEAGCERLAQDIATGRIRRVIESYEQSAGDYLFVVGSKYHEAL